jgi:hypothetical protein
MSPSWRNVPLQYLRRENMYGQQNNIESDLMWIAAAEISDFRLTFKTRG